MHMGLHNIMLLIYESSPLISPNARITLLAHIGHRAYSRLHVVFVLVAYK